MTATAARKNYGVDADLLADAQNAIDGDSELRLERIDGSHFSFNVFLGETAIGSIVWKWSGSVSNRVSGWFDSIDNVCHEDRATAINWLLDQFCLNNDPDLLVVKNIPTTFRICRIGNEVWEIRLGARGGMVAGGIRGSESKGFTAYHADLYGAWVKSAAAPANSLNAASLEAMAAFRALHGPRVKKVA